MLWLLGWKRPSPISYYNPLRYGRGSILVEHASIIPIVAEPFVRRLPEREKRGPNKGPRRHAMSRSVIGGRCLPTVLGLRLNGYVAED